MKNPMNKKNKVSFLNLISCILFLLFFLLPKKIFSQSFTSPNYRINWGNFNMTGGRKTSDSYTLTDSVGQNAPGQYDSDGFTVKAGFQYAYDSLNPFSFSIDNLDINFGSLTPNIGSTQSNTITITTPSGHGYEILAIQNHPLSNDLNTTIPDTTCNNNDCNVSTSAVWDNDTKNGFGFNAIGINSSGVATGIGTSNYFYNSSYFRPFTSQDNQPPQVIMSENNSVRDHSARVTYKVSVSTYQASGSYQNNINYIAIPKY